MIQLKMIVHVLSYRIEKKINLTRKKAQLYVGYTKGQHINGWSITLFQDLFNNSKSSMQKRKITIFIRQNIFKNLKKSK